MRSPPSAGLERRRANERASSLGLQAALAMPLVRRMRVRQEVDWGLVAAIGAAAVGTLKRFLRRISVVGRPANYHECIVLRLEEQMRFYAAYYEDARNID